MFISDFAIKRPLVTVVAMVALVVFGLVALFKLKTDEFPEVVPPYASVGLIYPGASPDGDRPSLWLFDLTKRDGQRIAYKKFECPVGVYEETILRTPLGSGSYVRGLLVKYRLTSISRNPLRLTQQPQHSASCSSGR